MNEQPGKEHDWLQQMVGEWDFEMPGMKPGEVYTGTESVRSVGGLWVMGEGKGQIPDGQPSTTFITLGYDPIRKKYVGTFFGSMMTYLWTYEGERSEDGKTLRLNARGPHFGDPTKLIDYVDTVTFEDENTRTLSSSMKGDDGQWQQFMVATYRRRK